MALLVMSWPAAGTLTGRRTAAYPALAPDSDGTLTGAEG
jgi:hypothetical protein